MKYSKNQKVRWLSLVLVNLFVLFVCSFASESNPDTGYIGGSKPVYEAGFPHWQRMPFNLRFDAKWTHQPNSTVSMNKKDEIQVKVLKKCKKKSNPGIRFSTGTEWEQFASDKKVKVTIETRSSNKKPLQYRVAYLTFDGGFSGWYAGIANLKPSTLSFDYKIPSLKKKQTDFVIVVPETENVDLIISDAWLEILNE